MSTDVFDGKVVFITGAASGIGRALAAALAKRSATLLLADIDADLLERTAWALGGEANDVHVFPLDVRKSSQWEHVVAEVYGRFDHVDYFFNNAGIAVAGLVRDTPIEDWERLFDVNVLGVVRGVDAFYPRMRDQGHGHIINTASISGLVPTSLMAAYSASKHAVVAFSETLRAEAKGDGIDVSVVCPGIIDTPMAHTTELRGADGTDSVLAKLPNPPFSVEEAVEQMLRGVERKRGIIVITREAYALWRLYRASPEAVLRVNEKTVRFLRRLTGATARR
ncbi:MAG: SDR family NAD(P)-dependent oxidoreductase [Polyangiales bacterium]|nr:SDR family NAD(P)-dependent oxidoreductase [Myxococcales bacterium]MCB9658110.1 SDR family NAD(P)-dependent oxidoreductase [Sandaracinaceae bacterium]